MTVPNEFQQLDTFPRLHNCTPKLPCILHPPFFVEAHPWLFLRLQLLHTLFASLIVLFLPFSVSFLLYRVFCVSVLAKLSTPFSREGAFLCSGFNFSHHELPFPYSRLYSVREVWFVIRVKGFRVRALHCVRANDLDLAFCIGSLRRGHRAFRESSFVSLAHEPR